MLELLTDPNAWAALVTLTALEIVLGIDNIVFISVLVSRCSPRDAKRARQIGLSLALVFRVILLLGLTWLMRLTYPVFSLVGQNFSWRDLILIAGGLILIAKATHEIHAEVESDDQNAGARLPGDDWARVGGGWIRLPHPARLHLFVDGVRRHGRSVQRAGAAQSRA